MSKSSVKVMVLGLRGIPNIQGGVESHSQHLYPRLVKIGYQIDVICRAPYVNKQMKQWKGVNLMPLWSPSSQGLEAMLHSIIGVLYAGIQRPDILHIHAIGPAIVTPLARLMGLNVVVTHHGPDYDREKWGWFAKALLRFGERMGMQFSTRRIVISKVIQSLVTERYNKNSELIPNGVVPAVILDVEGQMSNYMLEKNKYIVLVSRIVPEKRHLDLIRAFRVARLQGWKLVLVGDISDRTSFVKKVIAREKPDGILLSFGGQTALNCGIELYKQKVLEKHNVKVLGTPIQAIIDTEDREIFVNKLKEIDVRTPQSKAVESIEAAKVAAASLGYPIIIRAAYTLGGQGSGFCANAAELVKLASKAPS